MGYEVPSRWVFSSASDVNREAKKMQRINRGLIAPDLELVVGWGNPGNGLSNRSSKKRYVLVVCHS